MNNQPTKPVVAIIGAGPAGLTAALELARDGRMLPVVYESSQDVGGISRTILYKGNRMDIGGHRFFSKSEWVMNWWKGIFPVQQGSEESSNSCCNAMEKEGSVRPKKVFLIRDRLSRIYYLRKYFDYPIKLNWTTISNLGLVRILRIGVSYIWALTFKRTHEKTLEDFFVNRFGGELYRTFFKDYTEKVWGHSCDQISSEWGAQRIKGLSVIEALRHAWRSILKKGSVATKTSLIEHFLYPPHGPGQLWAEVASQLIEKGGKIHFGSEVVGLRHEHNRVRSLLVKGVDQIEYQAVADYVISTMPVKDLIAGMQPPAPPDVASIAAELPYRDFITVGLLLSQMRPNEQSRSKYLTNMPADNWIYVQERDVRIGRLQIFNNWSPALVNDSKNVWLGLEYFCQEGDDLWTLSDDEMISLASEELEKIGLIDKGYVLDSTVVRVPKTYPAYFGAYQNFSSIRKWVDGFENLFLVGRNGMHRYNNQDHSMLTAKMAVDSIVSGKVSKDEIWSVNIDDEYHEEVKQN